jgi:hypothetical protein
MLIDLPYEAVCKITTEELKGTLSNIRADHEARKNGKLKAGVFHADRNKDLRKIKKTIFCIEAVLKYYGVNLDA